MLHKTFIMRSIHAVLQFIQVSGLTTERFEKLARLEPGAINNAAVASSELAAGVIQNIVSILGPAFINHGFNIERSCTMPGGYKFALENC